MDPLTDSTATVLIQGGAVGLAIVALGLVFYALRLIGNHLMHVTATLRDTVNQMCALTGAIDRLVERIDYHLDQNPGGRNR